MVTHIARRTSLRQWDATNLAAIGVSSKRVVIGGAELEVRVYPRSAHGSRKTFLTPSCRPKVRVPLWNTDHSRILRWLTAAQADEQESKRAARDASVFAYGKRGVRRELQLVDPEAATRQSPSEISVGEMEILAGIYEEHQRKLYERVKRKVERWNQLTLALRRELVVLMLPFRPYPRSLAFLYQETHV